jgi:hypothetical protein
MTTQGFVAITLAIASANIHGIAYAAPWCHPGDKVTITAVIDDVKANLIHLKPEAPVRVESIQSSAAFEGTKTRRGLQTVRLAERSTLLGK